MKFVFLIPLLMVSAVASASIETITREVTGYGGDRETATANALVEAVSQINGVEINSQEVRKSLSAESFRSHNDSSVSEFSVDVSSEQAISRATGGFVDEYRILSIKPYDGGFAAELEVSFFRFRVPGLDDNRKTIAVLPFSGGEQLAEDHRNASESITRQVIDFFTQSRRFAVLDRENTAAFEAERETWLSDRTSDLEMLRMGHVRAADYLLIGEVVEVRSEDNSRTLQTTGERIQDVQTSVRVSYRIISPATREVNWASTETIKLSGTRVRSNDYAPGIARKIGQSALSNIYPARVVAIQSGQIVIGQGGSTIQEGETVEVFALGDPIQDPYTGKLMAQVEIPIGRAVVTRVTPRVAYIEPEDGPLEGLSVGAIVRSAEAVASEQNQTEEPRRKSNAEVQGTGVKLF